MRKDRLNDGTMRRSNLNGNRRKRSNDSSDTESMSAAET